MATNSGIYFWVMVISGSTYMASRFKYRDDVQEFIDLQPEEALITVVKGVDNTLDFKREPKQ